MAIKLKNFILQARDIQILGFLWVWKLATSSVIQRRFFANRSHRMAYLRLGKLRRAGYVQNQVVVNGCGTHIEKAYLVWTLNKKGFSVIKSQIADLDQSGFLSEHLEHDLVTSAFQLGNYLDGIPETVEMMTEQELRRLPPEQYPSWTPKSALHRPDGYWCFTNKNRQDIFAIEVELHRKQPTRYHTVAEFYSAYSGISRVIWLVPSKSFAELVQRDLSSSHVERTKIHNFILVADFKAMGWKAPVIFGPEHAMSLDQILPQQTTTTARPSLGLDLPQLWFSTQLSRATTISCTDLQKTATQD